MIHDEIKNCHKNVFGLFRFFANDCNCFTNFDKMLGLMDISYIESPENGMVKITFYFVI